MTNMMKKYLPSATNPPVTTSPANTSHTPSAPPHPVVGLYPVIHDPLPNSDANRSSEPTLQAPVFHITSGQVNLESDTIDKAVAQAMKTERDNQPPVTPQPPPPSFDQWRQVPPPFRPRGGYGRGQYRGQNRGYLDTGCFICGHRDPNHTRCHILPGNKATNMTNEVTQCPPQVTSCPPNLTP